MKEKKLYCNGKALERGVHLSPAGLRSTISRGQSCPGTSTKMGGGASHRSTHRQEPPPEARFLFETGGQGQIIFLLEITEQRRRERRSSRGGGRGGGEAPCLAVVVCHKPSHPYNAGIEHVGFHRPNTPSAKQGGVGICCLPQSVTL